MSAEPGFKDHFSSHAADYARSRPTYPPELFAFVASLAPGHSLAWDVGTGNGQAAVGLAEHFDHVIATDPSQEQLQSAFAHPKVEYRRATAEDSGLEPGSVDAVTVAQAAHWFDLNRFYSEVRRVLKPGGAVAIWCYILTRVSPEVDEVIDRYYYGTVGPYWPRERRLVDDGYASLPFPFDEVPAPDLEIGLSWTLDEMIAYLRTWSPTRLYIKANGVDPVALVEPELAAVWGERESARTVRWPIRMRTGLYAGGGQA
jgi:SAM-dependent methyltransferase